MKPKHLKKFREICARYPELEGFIPVWQMQEDIKDLIYILLTYEDKPTGKE